MSVLNNSAMELALEEKAPTTLGAKFRSGCKKLAVAGGAVLGAGQAMAVDHSAAITAATGDGTANLTAAVTGVIAIVAVVVGAGLVIRFLTKS